MPLPSEVKRKLFHHIALLYLLMYWFCPRSFTLPFLAVVLLVLASVEWIRLRRPEINAWFLGKFGGIHRSSEIMHFSGIFWTLLGCWLTMVIFTNPRIVLPALGFLVFGDSAAALVGKKWGKRHWPNSPKTQEGSLGFFIASLVWACFFLKWPVALAGAGVGAWMESRRWPYNDNLWIPLGSAATLSVLNLVLGR